MSVQATTTTTAEVTGRRRRAKKKSNARLTADVAQGNWEVHFLPTWKIFGSDSGKKS